MLDVSKLYIHRRTHGESGTGHAGTMYFEDPTGSKIERDGARVAYCIAFLDATLRTLKKKKWGVPLR
jgi:hypothetical protein